jgi:protein-disulfide isomerase
MCRHIPPVLRSLSLLLTAATTVALAAQAPSSPSTTTAATGDVVAWIDGVSITAGEVDEAIAGQLEKLNEQIYQLKLQRLNVIVDQRLIEREATRRGVSKEALIEAEVTNRAGQVSDAEIDRYYEENRGRLPNLSDRVRQQIQARLLQRKREALGQQFLATLRAAADIELLLPRPESARIEVSTSGDFTRGPANAPVTIVEFTDFHCPFCQRVEPTLDLLLGKYGEQVRLIHRDFPIDALHPGARQAHEAARCAGAQGAFWEFHHELFSESPKTGTGQLTDLARKIDLPAAEFKQCLEGRVFKDHVDGDIKEGLRVGITGTPTFFINGRRLEGARSLDTFSQVIEEELARAASNTARAPRTSDSVRH